MSPSTSAKIKAVIWALLKPFTSANDSTNIVNFSSANRVGPQRVILRIKLNGDLEGFNIDRVDVPFQALEFDLAKHDNENVCVSITAFAPQTTAFQTHREHKATLKVKPETNRLTLRFKDAHAAIYKTEQIEIM